MIFFFRSGKVSKFCDRSGKFEKDLQSQEICHILAAAASEMFIFLKGKVKIILIRDPCITLLSPSSFSTPNS